MKFKVVALIGLFLAGSITLSGCNVLMGELVDPGHVALLVDNYGADKGIEGAQLFEGGRVRYNPATQQYFEYPVYFQTFTFGHVDDKDNSIRFSLGGSPVSATMGVTYKFRYDEAKDADGKPVRQPKDGSKYTYLHEFFRLYRVSPETFTNTNLKNSLGSCATKSASGVDPIKLVTDTSKFIIPVTECLQKEYPQIEIKAVSISDVKLPETVQGAINAALKSQQDAQTAIANKTKAEAEAAANVAKAEGEARVRIVGAQAEADANAKINASLTPNVLELKRLEVEQARIEKWNGEMAPTVQTQNVQLGGQKPANK